MTNGGIGATAVQRGSALRALVEQLMLEQLEQNLFRGSSNEIGSAAVYGGQLLAQALMAAGRTVPRHAVHSLHCYFLRPGDKTAPIVYDVERVRDGTSFSMRRVVAIQYGQAIFHMSASFHLREDGVSHSAAMPDVPLPEQLSPCASSLSTLDEVFDLRFVDGFDPAAAGTSPPVNRAWLRTLEALPDDPLLHQALMAYVSDYSLLGVAMQPHGLYVRQPGVLGVSLDHAMWFHRDFRCDEWLLYDTASPNAAHARGFSRGNVFNREGRLVASVAQEGLIRVSR